MGRDEDVKEPVAFAPVELECQRQVGTDGLSGPGEGAKRRREGSAAWSRIKLSKVSATSSLSSRRANVFEGSICVEPQPSGGVGRAAEHLCLYLRRP